eukprot:8903519-Ditylum_brightwellii.AAC.1
MEDLESDISTTDGMKMDDKAQLKAMPPHASPQHCQANIRENILEVFPPFKASVTILASF